MCLIRSPIDLLLAAGPRVFAGQLKVDGSLDLKQVERGNDEVDARHETSILALRYVHVAENPMGRDISMQWANACIAVRAPASCRTHVSLHVRSPRRDVLGRVRSWARFVGTHSEGDGQDDQS